MNRTKIFLSYSQKDNKFALRIYNDLKRSNIDVWRFEEDSKKGVNFEKEFLNKIKEADWYFLLDSPSARNSFYVCKEIEFALDHFSDLNRILVIKLEKGDDWRAPTQYLSPELTEKLNKITHFDFSEVHQENDVYDQHDHYRFQIESVIKEINEAYIPWSSFPWMEDIQKELFAMHAKGLKMNKLSVDDQNILINDYKSAFHHWKKGNHERARSRLTSLVEETENLPTVAPELFLGRVMLDMDDLKAAAEIYLKVTHKQEKDPRGWFGNAISQFYLGNYAQSLQMVEKAIQATQYHPNNKHHQAALPSLISSQISILLALRKIRKAEKLLNELNDFYLDLPEIVIQKVHLLLEKEKYKEAQNMYNELEYLYEDPQNNPSHINFLLADLSANMGRQFALKENYQQVIYYYEKASYLNPGKLLYWGELAKYCHAMRKHSLKKRAVTEGLKIRPNTLEEHYYTGLLYYVDDNLVMSKFHYEKSKDLRWPWYRDLFG